MLSPRCGVTEGESSSPSQPLTSSCVGCGAAPTLLFCWIAHCTLPLHTLRIQHTFMCAFRCTGICCCLHIKPLFYLTTSVHPVSVLIHPKREQIMWSQQWQSKQKNRECMKVNTLVSKNHASLPGTRAYHTLVTNTPTKKLRPDKEKTIPE